MYFMVNIIKEGKKWWLLFIWHHKILVYERNFAESLGQTDVKLSLSMNDCVEMNMDSGEAA